MQPNPIELARKNLFEALLPVEIERYLKFGTIRVVGSDGEVYYVANRAAQAAFGIATIVKSDGSRICIDIPHVISDEKMLLFKKLLETDARWIVNAIIGRS